MKELTLKDLPSLCFDGYLPSMLATCSADGMPNATWITQIYYVDATHVAVADQFFKKTRENLDGFALAQALVIEPLSGGQWRLDLRFVGHETSGASFETMKMRIEALASTVNLGHEFPLRSADVFEVVAIRLIGVEPPVPPAPERPVPDAIAGLARLSESVAACTDLRSVVDTGLHFLVEELGYTHATLYLFEESEGALYTLASLGFAQSGVGARIGLSVGVVGACARHRKPIRIGDTPRERVFGRAVKEQLARVTEEQDREILLPGLEGMLSLLAVPLVLRGKLFGVLTTESERRFAFEQRDERVLATAGHLIAQAMALYPEDEGERDAPASESPRRARAGTLRVRYYAADDSVFVGDEYLIKGLPGRILWLICKLHEAEGRVTFLNRELRIHPFLRLPAQKDNLETRLLLLQRRLDDKGLALRINREQRGRLRLLCDVQIQLEAVGGESG